MGSNRSDVLDVISISALGNQWRWIPAVTAVAALNGCAESPRVPPEGLPELYAAVMADPEMQHVDAGGCVRVHEVWKAQVVAIHDTAGESVRDRVNALTKRSYSPYEDFWRGYLGGEEEFRDWAGERLDLAGDPRRRIPLAADPAEMIADATSRMRELTGRQGCAEWYVVYGPGWANLGGLGKLGMVVDFFGMSPTSGWEDFRAYLPHEVSHVIDGGNEGPSGGTLLSIIVSEGFASYVADVFFGDAMSPAESLGYSDDEWAWAVEHEAEIWTRVEDRLMTRDEEEIRPFRAASIRPLEGGPGKIGYFVGYRIVEAYVALHGRKSWTDLYDLNALEILERSGYTRARGRQTSES